MDDIGFDIRQALAWFPHEKDSPFTLVRVSDTHANAWAAALGVAVRRCYITDTLLDERAKKLGRPKSEILASKMPDPGSTMSGDFGEILVYLYQAAKEHPVEAIGPKKWRLKQDRTKPSPHSDVVHYVLPSWPTPSAQDVILCAEVKTKATAGKTAPIKEAIEGCENDRTGRLARTLVWLRERALTEDLGDIELAHLERFINATGHPPATKRFRAVAVVCSSLLAGELGAAPSQAPTDYTVVVISVPELHKVYSGVFDAAHRSVQPAATSPRAPARASQ